MRKLFWDTSFRHSFRRYTIARSKWLASGSLVVGLAACVFLIFPYAASAYHLEAGGRALDQIGESANPHLESAIRHLQAAIQWEKGNAQAYRLLGRAYLAQGDLMAAREALTHYTELRPNNPLGHIELAGVYEAIEAELASHTHYDFLAHLPEARIETAGFWIDTGFCEEGDPPEKCYVAETAFHMPDDATARPTLFMHAPSRASYTLTLPAEPAVLYFGMGLHPMTWGWGGDGVAFEVFVDTGGGEQQIFAGRLDTPKAMEGWKDGRVDLSSYAGRTVTLTLSVIPGPEWEMTGDWAGWGEPHLVEAAALSLAALRPAEQTVREWKAAGLTAQDFIARGEEERKAERYEEALEWYERAKILAPANRDSIFYSGVVFVSQENYEQALLAFQMALALKNTGSHVGDSDIYYQIGRLHQLHFQTPNLDEAFAAYDNAITKANFSNDNWRIDTYYRRGEVALWKGEASETTLADFEKVISLRPNDLFARILWAAAYYDVYRDASKAEAELMAVIALDPENKWAYSRLGMIYQAENRLVEAASAFRQVLLLDPDDTLARERLDALEKMKSH